MNSRQVLIAIAVLVGATLVFAAPVERAVQDRWDGAWVVTRAEIFSDCAGGPTPNRFRDDRIRSDGRHGFGPGELARVVRVDVNGGRVRLYLELPEPILRSRRDGPFNLFDEAICHIRLQVETPPQALRDGNTAGVELVLREILLRFPSEAEARASADWNRRSRDPYPHGYERTLLEHSAWMLEKVNEKARERFERIMRETSRVADRMNGDADYSDGFFEGVQAARSVDLDSCQDILKFELDEALDKAVKRYRKKNQDRSAAARDGFRDGHIMVYGMKILGRMPDCLVPASEAIANRSGG
jgi:hypothetical protein